MRSAFIPSCRDGLIEFYNDPPSSFHSMRNVFLLTHDDRFYGMGDSSRVSATKGSSLRNDHFMSNIILLFNAKYSSVDARWPFLRNGRFVALFCYQRFVPTGQPFDVNHHHFIACARVPSGTHFCSANSIADFRCGLLCSHVVEVTRYLSALHLVDHEFNQF